MSRLNLSNLLVRPNLLSAENYQQEMLRCSVFELRNIKERNPDLVPNPLPSGKQQEWRDSLEWGDSPPPPLTPSWPEHLAGGLPDAVRELENRPTLEAAFECLVVARQLYHSRPDSPARSAAAEWDRRVCFVLGRDEFRYTPNLIDERLESILGHRLTGPPSPNVQPVEPPAVPPAPASHSRQPTELPLVTNGQAESDLLPFAIPLSAPAPRVVIPPMPNGDSALIPPRVEAEPQDVPHPKPAGACPTLKVPHRPTTTLTVWDADLKRLIQRWATLPDHVKKCVTMLLDAADATRTSTE